MALGAMTGEEAAEYIRVKVNSVGAAYMDDVGALARRAI